MPHSDRQAGALTKFRYLNLTDNCLYELPGARLSLWRNLCRAKWYFFLTGFHYYIDKRERQR